MPLKPPELVVADQQLELVKQAAVLQALLVLAVEEVVAAVVVVLQVRPK